MHLLMRLSLRNLFRQKRRNILLGMAMAFGVMILVIANSFSHGISDIMFNKILRWVTGHVSISFYEKSRMNSQVFRDKERLAAILQDEKDNIIVAEEAIGMFMRAIGNGKSDNVVLVGVDTTAYKNTSEKTMKEVEESFRLIEGSWDDLSNKEIENAAIVSEEKARYLNVKKNDVIRLRFRNIAGQDQAARVTVRGIMKNDNIFMQPVIFVDLKNVKEIMGYRPYETGNIAFTIKEPVKNAAPLADRIHARLKPETAVIYGKVKAQNKQQSVAVFGSKSDESAKKKLTELLKLKSGTLEKALAKDGVIVSQPLAAGLNVKAGDEVTVEYGHKFDNESTALTYTISAIAERIEGLGDNFILVNEEKFYTPYYENLPKPLNVYPEVKPVPKDAPIAEILAPEWILLNRTANTDEYKKKFRELGKKKWKGTVVDVTTMYESASDILKLEGVLNLITLSAVMVLFFIIVLGVINTLRMTIRERTREIGTVRAIGMQRNEVRSVFIFETFFLTLFAAIAGVIMAFVLMKMLSLFTIQLQDNPFGMLLVNGHLHFMPTVFGVIGNILIVIVISVLTAYFPAKRAANLLPAKALRHFE